MRGTYFDKNTGYFLHSTKNGKDPISADLKRQGHMLIEGAGLSRYRYDFVAGELVVDERRQQWEEDRQDRRDQFKAAYATLVANKGNPATTRADLDLVVDLLGYIAPKLK